MSSVELALLRTICETPDCDVPRLVYADWLEEHGQHDRAEFIRLLCQISPTGTISIQTARRFVSGDIDDPYGDITEIDAKIARLLSEYGTSWCSSDGSSPAVSRVWGWSRGFLSEIRCTLAQFMGGTCWNCEGTKREPGSGEYDDTCGRCRGIGMTLGLAEKLFIQHPITQVVLTGREPLEFEGRWLWHNADHRLTSSEYDGDTRSADHLPAVIFDRLTGFAKRNGRVAEMVKNYPTRESAQQALSIAAVNYGRSLHGFSPIPG
jgi:uncharacterized protein (TIGR02996 family)